MVAIIVPDQTHGNNCQSRVPIYLELMRLSRTAICRNDGGRWLGDRAAGIQGWATSERLRRWSHDQLRGGRCD